MSIVKPPKFSDLLHMYGDPIKAVEHLSKSGFSAEEISRRFNIPYFLVRLLLAGFRPKREPLFSDVVKVYNRLALLRSRRGKETELVKFLKRGDIPLEVKVRLALGQMADDHLKIGEGVIMRALSMATSASQRRLQRLLIEYGELGEVAALVANSKRHRQLSVDDVYLSIRLLPYIDRMWERTLLVSSLLENASPDEARYIVRLLLGDLKLGFHESSLISAVSRLYKVQPELLQSACAILGLVDGLTMAPQGNEMLAGVKLRPGRFLKPQLAHIYEPDKISFPVRVEYKYDGSRLQIHKLGSHIWLFSRRGIEKSKTLPEVVEIVKSFSARSCIVDSEVVAIDEDGNLLPFQSLLERTVPRDLEKDELIERMKKITVTVKAFDILYLNGVPLIDMPLCERRRLLLEVVPKEYLAEGVDCNNEADLMKFYENALNRGLEGVVVKDLNSRYEVGKRTYTWLKIKPERDTIDAVIVKALYGKGRRAGLFSSFLLAVRDPKIKRLYTIGKVSNLPEETMEFLTSRLERLILRRDEEGVFVEPSIIVEVTYQEIQATDEYTSGYALRVPKVVRIRQDKAVEDIDTLEKIHKLFSLQYERYAPK
ncbi:ATP-dependent DNA ligase [Candidatus Bathyarchaeota archaeon]|nr:MAG: ATP-dependent DNA ligase [Candidatus Bathyarchaeota archaeon]